MKKNLLIKSTLICTLMSAVFSGQAMAESKRVSDGIKPGDTNSKWLLGATFGGVNNELAGDDSNKDAFVHLNLGYRGEKLFVAGDEIGFNLHRYNNISLGAVLTAKTGILFDRDYYDDSDILIHLEERDPTLDLGFYFIHNSDLGQLRMRFVEEITGEHDGHSIDASYTFDLKYNGWRINPFVEANYMTDDATDYFFGVSEEESTARLAAYDGKSGVTISTGVEATYALTEHWDLGFGTSVTKLHSGIGDSSLLTDDMIYSASMTVNYNF